MKDSPYLKVDINCTGCGKLIALANARQIDHQYLCGRCYDKKEGPTKKAPAIDKLITSLTPTGLSRQAAYEKNVCTWCGSMITIFRDELSKKEYTISGMCQKCQDKIFEE